MKTLLQKEFRLAMHPTNLLFLSLSALLLIPNYPYYVTFFYTGLGLFFTCLSARENHDVEYTMALPVRKRDLVRARVLFAVLVELAQGALAVPFALLRQRLVPMGNQVGMDANLAFFGFSFLLLGLFNYVFFTRYYRAPDKVGKAFAMASTGFFLCMVVLETLTHALPVMRDQLDTPDPLFLSSKLTVLAAGLLLYGLLTLRTVQVASRRFEALDL